MRYSVGRFQNECQALKLSSEDHSNSECLQVLNLSITFVDICDTQFENLALVLETDH